MARPVPTKASELLERAKEFLWDGTYPAPSNKEEYICFAIREATRLTKADWQLRQEIVQTIDERLSPSVCLRLWLHDIGGVDWSELKTVPVQKHRLAWMDQLIQEYKAKGN